MKYVVWDIETDSAQTDWATIIEIGGILLDENFKELERFSARCRMPQDRVPSATALCINKSNVDLLTKFKQIDTTGDGKISKSEYDAAVADNNLKKYVTPSQGDGADLFVNIEEVGYDSNGAMDFNQKSQFYNLKWTYVGYGSDDVLYGTPFSDTFMGIPGNDILWGRGENAANANVAPDIIS